MRHPRIKFAVGQDGFMHVYNRTVGSAQEFPFGPQEKAEFLRRLNALNAFYAVEVVAAVVMGNHYHAILYVPAEPPGDQETIARYRRRYPTGHPPRPGSKRCRQLALRLRDVSALMKDLQQPFTRWFNRTRPQRRRGHLWAERYRNTLLEKGQAVWNAWKYIEMNPVRAGCVATPAAYRFGSFGQWCATGRHPYQPAFETHLLPWLQGLLGVHTPGAVHRELRRAFAEMKAGDAEQALAGKAPFTTRLDRRVRYWVDGLVIGSQPFVRETMVQARGEAALAKRRFTRAVSPGGEASELYCFKQLRVRLE